jgi:hypothetical protein
MQVGEAHDPDVTPIMRPTLVMGREHIYQNEYDLAEMKRKLNSRNTLPMPPNCALLIERIYSCIHGGGSAESWQEVTTMVSKQELLDAVEYCQRQKWLNVWGMAIELTRDGVEACARQLEFDRVSGHGRWSSLPNLARTMVVSTVAEQVEVRSILAVARAVASRFSANEGSIRSWINRDIRLRESILRGIPRKP